jgi:threonine/homoserine/homoserine lactone efflux protein
LTNVISSTQLAEFALASFVLIVIPGPSVLFVVGRALAHGRRTALASVVGNAFGVYVVAACVAFGLGRVVQSSEIVFTIVKIAGAAYLMWLGVQAIRHRSSLSAALTATGSEQGAWRAARQGFVVGVANPKVLILFGAILPQFVDRSAGHVSEQMLVLSVVSFVIAVVSDSIWAVTASAVRSWFANSPQRLGLVGGIGGLAMIGVGVTVLGTGRKD